MLLKTTELKAIKAGKISLVFRRWRKPTVKTGGTLKTDVGVLAIDQVTEINRSQISLRDAVAAGYKSLSNLLDNINSREGKLYRIKVRFSGADPRIKLRNQNNLDQSELISICSKLDHFDSMSKSGKWTRSVLRTINCNPHVRATVLAKRTGFEKEWLKINIRKLKNLGLTISHQPGYELSPRGITLLDHLEEKL